MPTTPESEARSFILERISLQTAAIANLDNLLKKAIQRILAIARKYRIPPKRFDYSSDRRLQKEVQQVIDDLLADLITDIQDRVTYGITDKDERSTILLWLIAIHKGKTITQRLTAYLNDLLTDIRPQVAASLASNNSTTVDTLAIFSSLTHPQTSSLYRRAVNQGYPGTEPKRSPVGVYVYAYNNLKRAIEDQVARTRQQVFYDIRHHDTTHWLVMRGSRYPCSLCDSMCGITNRPDNLPPFHPNCCCIAVPLD